MKITEELADRIYDILVKDAGAYEPDRSGFVHRQSNERITEWRFCGSLGFGGKFWNNNGRLYVSCYREDSTPEREAIIEKVNAQLEELTP